MDINEACFVKLFKMIWNLLAFLQSANSIEKQKCDPLNTDSHLNYKFISYLAESSASTTNTSHLMVFGETVGV